MHSANSKRLQIERKRLKRSDLNDSGIYAIFDEKDMRIIKVLIFGPNDTPYEKGTFFFAVKLTPDYPFKPPKVKFLTNDGNVRFHPNLYENGKVCLSILGTYSGPP